MNARVDLYPFDVRTAGAAHREAPDIDSAGFISAACRFYEAFSAEECRRIRDFATTCLPVRAGLVRPIENYRLGTATHVDLSPDSRWIFERLATYISAANFWYRFDVTGIGEPLLYAEYPAGGGFGWHIDCGAGETCRRKISVSLQLSGEGEYEGGGLEFATTGEAEDARGEGTIIAFPAFVPHRVERVTAGTRRALVAWAYGPPFR